MRSGSTFVGELFNQNEQFSYFFEPLYEFRSDIYGGNTDVKRSIHDPLKTILLCNFKKFGASNWWTNKSRRRQWDCLHSDVVQMSPLCEFNEQGQEFRPRKYLRNNLEILEAICKNRKHTAVKTIRVADIGYLKELVTDADMNIKIVHLVRDPRAVYLSRMMVSKSPGNVSYSCKRLETNVKYWKNTPKWLSNRYMLMRYEDLADDPLKVANRLYKFIGIPMPLAVKEWLWLNTELSEEDAWSTTRNSRKAARMWRYDLSIQDVMKVQQHCHKVMAELGYRLMFSEETLENSEVPIVDKLFQR